MPSRTEVKAQILSTLPSVTGPGKTAVSFNFSNRSAAFVRGYVSTPVSSSASCRHKTSLFGIPVEHDNERHDFSLEKACVTKRYSSSHGQEQNLNFQARKPKLIGCLWDIIIRDPETQHNVSHPKIEWKHIT